MAVNIKAYLGFNTENREIRRFTIEDKSWENLVKKLKDLFPCLREADFKVYWTDEDEELVMICSNEELEIAVENSGKDVLKIYIMTPEVENADSQKESCTSGTYGPMRGHPCRGRGGGRRGFGGRGKFCRGGVFGPFRGAREFGFDMPPPPHFPHHSRGSHHPHGPQHPPPFHPLFNAWFSLGANPFEDPRFGFVNGPFGEANTDVHQETGNANEEDILPEEADDVELARCISHMEAMGFSDDGGWLKALIQEKNCDIDKVLEALQPERPGTSECTE